MPDTKNILVINFGGIGDEILFLPAIISLKKEFPNAHITLALEERSLGIKELTDKIDEFLPLNIKSGNKYKELFKLIFDSWLKPYDIVISSGSNKFIPFLLLLMGIKTKIGYDNGFFSQKILTHAVKLNKNQYASAMYHDLVSPLTENKTEIAQLHIKKSETVKNSVLIHPGVSLISVKKGITKTITPEIWAEVLKILTLKGKNVRLIGGPDDKECIEKIVKLCQDVKFENLYGKTKNLKDLAKLISGTEKFVCSDSAPMHIAVALGVKTYAIFGPTDDKKLAPPDVVTLKTNDSCPIKPCLWERRQTSCDNPVCLNFNADDIVQQILNN